MAGHAVTSQGNASAQPREAPAAGLPAWPVWVLAATVPAIAIGNALVLLLTPLFADFQYALPGFPDDPYGLAGDDRRDLAVAGIESVRPIGDGSRVLEEARLPNGEAAFEAKEISHMEDVRGLLTAFFVVWVAAIGAAVGCFAWLRHRSAGAMVRRGLTRGAIATVAGMALAGLLMLVAFELFFDGFHAIFFEGDTWRFKDWMTLRRLYPDEFWGIAAATLAALVLAQAAALWAYSTSFWTRRTR